MKNIFTILLLLIIIVFSQSCATDVETVNFHLNGKDVPASIQQPNSFDGDTSKYSYDLAVGDTVYFRNLSFPEEAVTKIDWYWNDKLSNDKIIKTKEYGENFYPIIFPKTGFKKITLCLNDDETLCVTKWVYVLGNKDSRLEEEAERSLLCQSIITFQKPSKTVIKTTKTIFPIEIKIDSLPKEKEKEIALYIDESEVSFEFKDGKLTAELTLLTGENKVRITVCGEEKELMIEKVLITEKGRSNPPKLKIVLTKPITNPLTFDLKTNIASSKLRFSLNDESINPILEKISGGYRVSDIYLMQVDQNVLQVSGGGKSDKIVINYNPSKEGEHKLDTTCPTIATNSSFSIKLTPTQTLNLTELSVQSDIGGSVEITINGKQLTKTLANKAISQIKFGNGIELQGNQTYTLTLSPSYNAEAGATPQLFALKCNTALQSSKVLRVKQGNEPILFNLKYKY